MSTATDRAAELRRDIEGNFALSAAAYARGDFAAGANFMRQVDDLRAELAEVER